MAPTSFMGQAPILTAVLLAMAAGLAGAGAWLGGRRLREPWSQAAALSVIAGALWVAAEALELAAVGFDSKFLWQRVQVIGFVAIPPAWLWLTFRYTGSDMPRWVLSAIAVFVGGCWAMGLSSGSFQVFFEDLGLGQRGSIIVLEHSYGPGFYLYLVGAIAMVTASAWLLWPKRERIAGEFGGRTLSLIVVPVVTLIAATSVLFGTGPLTYVDAGPVAFALATAWVLGVTLRRSPADITTVSRDLVVAQMEDGVLVLDEADRIVDLNPAAGRMLGLPADCRHQVVGELCEGWPAGLGGLARAATVEVPLGSGRSRQVLEVSLKRLGEEGDEGAPRVAMIRDVTERRRAARELQKVEKLEPVRLMVGGVAHDFKNVLAVVLGRIDLCAMDVAEGTPAAESLAGAREAVRRAVDLSRHLVLFARGGSETRTRLPLRELVEEAAEVTLRGTGVRWELECDAELEVEVDSEQMLQAVSNVIRNSLEAMPEGGRLALDLTRVRVGADVSQPLRPGSYAQLRVSDAGTGIPPSVLPRVCDPFFSTKPGHSGLGLATAYAVVRENGGHVWLESSYGEGTTVFMDLPLPSEADAAGSPA